MIERVFQITDNIELIVKHRKSAVFFELGSYPKNEKNPFRFAFHFSEEAFVEFINYLESISHEAWNNFSIKEEDCFAADYSEYYDRELDNNGYIWFKAPSMHIERPCKHSNRLYKFNKRKMEAMMYDLLKKKGM